MEEKLANMPEPKNIKNYLMENDEMIYNIKYLVEKIKEDLLGGLREEKAENPSPTCMIHLLEIENCNLKTIINYLDEICITLKPNN